MDSHPYSKYKKLKAWQVLNRALRALEKNNDIEMTTQSEYIIGYLLKCLEKENIIDKNIQLREIPLKENSKL